MAIDKARQTLKEIISFDLIDVEGTINTQGNYVYLNSTSKHTTLESKYTFIITIAGMSLTKSSGAIEPVLAQALGDIHSYELKNAKDLQASSQLVTLGDLLAYELKVTLVEKTN